VALLCTYNEAELDRNPTLRDLEQSLLALGVARLMRLDALSQGDIEELVCRTFEVDHQPARQLARRLYSWTRGHPFFVEETIKTLVESGRLYERGGSWLGWEVEGLDLPRSVRSAVGARLETLGEDARTVAGVAAVLGARLRFEALRAVCGLDQERLLSALDELCRSGMLVEAQQSGGGDGQGAGDYEFAHPMVQDVVYDGLGVARSRLLHGDVAAALESLFGDRALQHADALAFHYSRADAQADAGKAALYLAAAGRDALARHADRAAADYLTAALERRSDDASIVEDLAKARQRLGEYDAAMALWRRAKTAAEARSDFAGCARIERRMALACEWSGRFEEALAHFDSALASAAKVVAGASAAAETTARAASLRAEIRLSRGTCLQSLGKPREALSDLSAALETAGGLDDPLLLARAHNALLFLHVFIGPPRTAREHGEKGLALSERATDRTVKWSAHYGLALLAALTGDGELMLQHLGRAEGLAEELQSPLFRLYIDELATQYAFASGDWDAGIALAERTIGAARALNQRTLLPRVLAWATHFYNARGELDRSKAYLDEAWELAVGGKAQERYGSREGRGSDRPIQVHSQVAVYASLAAYHLARNEPERALEIGERGLSVADAAGYTVWATYLLLPVTLEASFWQGETERSRRLHRRWREGAAQLEHGFSRAWGAAGDGIIARLEHDYARAAELLREAIDELEKVPWVYDAARLRRWLADVLLRVGERDAGLRELRKSHEICARLGARVELERARDMMKQLGLRLPPREAAAPGGARLAKLTDRENDIARLVVARKSNKEIASALGISARTVTTHVANIFAKLGISSRGELADRMRDHG
jgi:DNA-binding NarL/FixJ family response regulator